MSLSNKVVKHIYTGDNAETDFSIPFDVIKDESQETVVYLRDESDPTAVTETLQVESSDYSLIGSPATLVRFSTAPGTGIKVLVTRYIEEVQETDLLSNTPVPVDTIEEQLDYVTALAQGLLEKLGRAPVLPVTNESYPFNLPEPQATTFWGWDDAYGFKYYTALEIQNLIDAATGAELAAIRTTQGTSEGDLEMGSFTGALLSDDQPVKPLLQEIETELESLAASVPSSSSFNGLASQTDATVTGLIFDGSSTTRGFSMEFLIIDANDLVEMGEFRAFYNGSTWEYFYGTTNGDDAGVSLTVNSSGQVLYTSGAETFTLKYNVITFDL